ncbi:hypothetical protein [Pseudomonas urmiensis]|uniref:Uncharacterized protein n=2 Tax=Pseudomonas TaxID=286 RepID=A0A923G162_9PSED|nr:hypothetical protein [Pseudomonas urmiensis]MBV4535336.1 hypothetical protein [Pseudomonas urmiensis]
MFSQHLKAVDGSIGLKAANQRLRVSRLLNQLTKHGSKQVSIMQNLKAIKWTLWALVVVCFGQMLYIYASSPARPDPDRVVAVTPVGEGGAIYEVLYGSGGATVPYVYRYFVMDLQASEEAVLKKTKKATPFLVTQSTGAVRGVEGITVKLRTSETIYDFHNRAYFKTHGELNIVKFDLHATLP